MSNTGPKTLNLGVLAHVDAGKTSLTERLLHTAGVIDEIGSVDRGDTQTDTLALERSRGITIRSAVASFALGDVTVNLIDTPGHPDFIAEVERVLTVLDGAVLVISAVEGVQAQTRILARTLRRLGIPVLLFVNKIDRRGADCVAVLRDVHRRLGGTAVAMGTVAAQGTSAARFTPHDPTRPGTAHRLAERLAEHDDALLAAYVGDAVPAYPVLHRELAAQTAALAVMPAFFGSAITGAGITDLVAGITELLPSAPPDPAGPLSGKVFKVERGPADAKIAYARLFGGTLRVRDRLPGAGRVTAIEVFDQGRAVRAQELPAGRIGTLRGLTGVRVGDAIGVPREGTEARFAPPTLETVVVPKVPARKALLHHALTQLAEQDPLIDVRQDDVRGEFALSLYGEVQKEVVEATLADEYGVGVEFRETTTICVERLMGNGCAAEHIGTDTNPFLATVGLRLEPAPPGTGVEFRLEVELGSMPLAFFTAVEESAREALRQGLHGWEVPDCVVVMTHSGYWARQSHAHGTFDKSMSSTAGDFKHLTPLVLMDALHRAGTVVHEPIHRLSLIHIS
ncbi:GTP-binding protein, partial [Lentzea aerocolonigenes]